MIKFLTTSAVASEIEAVLLKAERKVVLVAPYLKFSDTFIQRLHDATHKGVHIHIVYREDDLQASTRDVFHSLNNLHLYNCPNLHAKCYFNERSMVITSMNLYEFSEKNNREMGVLVSSDESLYRDAAKETESIMAASAIVPMQKHRPSTRRGEPRPRQGARTNRRSRGYCIRCSDSISHNLEKPLCPDCFAIWAQWNNPDHREKHCHTCGTEAETSMAKPQCYTCYWSESA